jgi:uncharacterized protein
LALLKRTGLPGVFFVFLFFCFELNICSLYLHFLFTMSPRPKRNRKIERPPLVKGFKPMGQLFDADRMVVLLFEEYESIRLCDYVNLAQEKAAEMMDVSRPTFTRIYNSARQKIAKALTESRMIYIDGGNVEFTKSWFECKDCGSSFKEDEELLKEFCEICHSYNIKKLDTKDQ